MAGISFFSLLAWCFFLTSVIGAMVLTTLHSPLVRRYRSTLLSITLSCLFLGLISGFTPYLLKKLNPDESRLVPIEQLTATQRSEPVENPTLEISKEELSFTERLRVKFRYKLRFPFTFKKYITAYEHTLVMLDDAGNIRGFDAYSGMNHWSIPLKVSEFIAFEQNQKRLFILDHSSKKEILRVTCIDLQTPSAVWQRTIPGSSQGGIHFNFDTQTLLITTGSSGVWALQAKTGEIAWKRPEIYSVMNSIHAGKYWIVFEPEVAKKKGAWYWIDEQSGKMVSKVAHGFLKILRMTPLSDSVLVQTESTETGSNLVRLQEPELNPLWSFPITDPLIKIIPYGKSQFLLVYQNQLAELRNISDHGIVWQKKLTDIEPRFVRLTPDYFLPRQPFLLLPNETNEVFFFNLQNGDWQFAAKTSEPVQDTAFFGDWLYLISENTLWAYFKTFR